MTQFKIYNGNCLDVLRNAPDNFADSIVCDPPYGLAFMGKKWDYDVPSVDIWKECLRVLKPGGHLLAFGGTRTYHRLVVAIEDAGFEIRDQIQWIYGQGFPKSQDISKAIDKAAGAEREVVGEKKAGMAKGVKNMAVKHGDRDAFGEAAEKYSDTVAITAPATPEAKQWSGWGTALKPANEPICLARKPLSETTIAKNVLKHGTGGLNIDGTRVGTSRPASHMDPNKFKSWKETDGNERSPSNEPDLRTDIGRFPANVILDEDAAKVLDEQTGITGGGKFSKSGGRNLKGESRSFGAFDQKVKNAPDNYGDEGGASRFFYVAKASKSDRGEGNVHPTVKPIKLMEYLIKLVTPEGGIVLDPFMGSGTTGVAAVRNGFQFRGVELDEKYFHIAQARLEKEIV
jgi:site-specific DNA-methyltransferase (adenine-specific)